MFAILKELDTLFKILHVYAYIKLGKCYSYSLRLFNCCFWILCKNSRLLV